MDSGGNCPNQINWIRQLNNGPWIDAMSPDRRLASLGLQSKVAKSISARVVRTTRTLCDDITSCESLIVKLADFGETRTPGAALISDPEATFGLNEADLPDDITALLSEECDYRVQSRLCEKSNFRHYCSLGASVEQPCVGISRDG